MRWCAQLALLISLVQIRLSAKETPALLPCPPGASDVQCNPSSRETKEAKAAFSRGLKIQEKSPDEAYREFERASNLVPRNVEYVTARELAKQQLVSKYIQRGSQEMEAGKQIEAVADFRRAMNLDPTNQFAQQRLLDVAGRSAPKISAGQIVSAFIAPSSGSPYATASCAWSGTCRAFDPLPVENANFTPAS